MSAHDVLPSHEPVCNHTIVLSCQRTETLITWEFWNATGTDEKSLIVHKSSK